MSAAPRPERSPSRRWAAALRQNARWIEIATAASLTVLLVWAAPLRLYAAIIGAGLTACRVAFPLSHVDPATLGDAAVALLRAILVVLPIIVAFARAHPRRLVWAPLTLVPIVLALALAPHGLSAPAPMIALSCVSIGASVAQVKPWLRWTAGLPLMMALHPTITTHQPFSAALPGARARLVERCAENDGERPVGVDPVLFAPHFYAVTPFDDSRLLLTGEGASSHWVVREPGGTLRIAEQSSVSGNYWHGTRGLGALWVAHRDDVREVRWADGRERVRTFSLLGVREPWEVDALDAVFDEASRSVWIGELASGSLIAVPIDGRPPRRFDHGLFYLQLAPRRDGEIVGISTTELVVFDTRTGAIRERQPAALCAGGVATCSNDGAVAVTDFAGRVRLFEPSREGRYLFVRGAPARSPRRVAFSPDCTALAVTSADDETVLVLDRADLSVLHRYRLGPGLRDVHWLPDGDLLVVDACTVTRLQPLEERSQ